MADRLRSVNVNAVLMYGGDSVQMILSNIYMAGIAIGYELRAAEVITSIESAMKDIVGILESTPYKREVKAMYSLSPDKSPWVTGSDTYVDDISSKVMGKNVFPMFYQWVIINSEQILASNPSVIIILTVDYSATQEEYDSMIRSLSAEWRSTDAYKNGNIYMVCETAGGMSETPSPRFIQLMELTARMLHPDVFTDLEMPKYIGDNYEDYLTFTKHLDFNY
jgi:iron complex transport system substrate-binding protein